MMNATPAQSIRKCRPPLKQNVSGIDRLFNTVIEEQGLYNDAALAKFLEMEAPSISKLRIASRSGGLYNGKPRNVSAEMMIAIHEKTGMSIARIKALVAA